MADIEMSNKKAKADNMTIAVIGITKKLIWLLSIVVSVLIKYIVPPHDDDPTRND